MKTFTSALLLLLACHTFAATRTVGTGKTYARIEDAYAAAAAGDTIAIYRTSGSGYMRPMLNVQKANLKFVGMETTPVVLDGTGGDYSGAGSVPRAIFQASPGGDGLVIENLDLKNAHNSSHNGAGVRINQAKRVTVRKCLIHGNDMGIMSNGDSSSTQSASDQLIEYCRIYANGNLSDPGYNHNLYLGGTSATVQYCEIFGALTGHNFKSRAHFNLVRYNYIHDSANREFDLVDAWDTSRSNSHSVLLGNLIVKKTNMDGNRGVIHFGQDGGGTHVGTITLINNTIVTTYISPIVQLTSAQSQARFFNNVIYNAAQSAPTLVSGQALSSAVGGTNNWISKGYSLAGTTISAATRYSGPNTNSQPGFVNLGGGDYQLLPASATYAALSAPTYLDGLGASKPGSPAFQYKAIASNLAISWTSKRYVGFGLKR